MATTSGSTAIALLLSIFLGAAVGATIPPYTPTDYILLDCGSVSSSTSYNNRSWQADTLSNYLPSNSLTISQISNASAQYEPPYSTARIIRSKFTYSFPSLSTGPKFLRLYFYRDTYIQANNQTLNLTESFFSVKANQNNLLSNFSAFLIYPTILVKEYIVHINDSHQQLNITILPNPGSYAFINGIEIYSIPDDLYFKGDNVPIRSSTNNPYYLKNDTALETLYRLNVGGSYFPSDNYNMFTTWEPDDSYILEAGLPGFPELAGLVASSKDSRDFQVKYTSSNPAYTAPEFVYTCARVMNDRFSSFVNMTWLFPVDSGFYYLLRLHFCEFSEEISQPGQRLFSILIGNQIVENEADVFSWAHGPKIAVSRDYVSYVGDPDGEKSMQNLSLTMKHVEILSMFNNAFLNGLEIFKISLSNGSFNSQNPVPASVTRELPPKKNTKIRWLPILAGTTAGTVALVVIFIRIFVLMRRKTMNDSATLIGNHELPLIVNSICRHFSFDEMKRATCNFDDNSVIGVGGFGSVYSGYIDNNSTAIAIKRLNPLSNQGVHEFRTEIEMLSTLRHLHLVSLIGYCNENGEMILVYAYMSRGTLRDHLYNTEKPHLPWKRRLQICIGVARGLHYLHTGSEHTIIHRDIKSTNILLDEKWVAKVSDFGLSKMGPVGGTKGHVSTVVKGSFGYLDPEYFLRQQLTEKSDVYSFGVVLIEVLCACPAITQNFSGEHVNLAEWAQVCEEDGILEQITDPTLEGEIASDSLTKYVEIAFKCLRRKGADRPATSDVVWNLEFALQLQKDAEKVMSFKISEDEYEASPSRLREQQGSGEPSTSSSGFTNLSIKSHDLYSN